MHFYNIFFGNRPGQKKMTWVSVYLLVAKLNSTGIHCDTLNQFELLQNNFCQHKEWQNQNSRDRLLSGNQTKAMGYYIQH